jgi:hypothetical protein
MSDELIDSYIDRAAVADDTKYFLDSIGQIMTAYDKLNAVKITLAGASSMSDIVSGANEAKKAVDTLTASTDKLLKSDILVAKVAKERANADIAKAKAAQVAAKGSQDKARADQLEAKALKDLAAAEKIEAQAQKELAIASKATAQARKENAAAAIKEQQLSNSSAREKEKQQLNEIGAAYREYSKAAREASLRAKSYALTLGENDPRTQAAVKNAKEMNETLARVDASVGQFGRNVGNYKSGFDGLANSFTQISRELPSLAVSFQTFALAVSNNLPTVVDEVKKASTEVKELRAQGEQTPGVFKRVLSSMLSLNVGLSVAIALFTAYAGAIADAVTGLFDSEAATKKARAEQEQYNLRLEESIELQERFNQSTTRDSGTQNRALENQIAYLKAAGGHEKEVLKLERDLLDNRQKLASQQFFATKGETELDRLKESLNAINKEAEELLKKNGMSPGKVASMFGLGGVFETPNFSEEDKKRVESLKQQFDAADKAYLRQKGIVEEFYNANRDLAIKDIEIQKQAQEQRLSFFAEPIERQRELLSKLSEFAEFGAKQQINFAEDAAKKQKEIINGQYQDDLFAAKDNNIKKQELERKHAFDLLVIDEELEKRRLEIHAQALIRQREMDAENIQLGADEAIQADEDRLNRQIEALQLQQARRQKETAKGQQIEIKALNEGYRKAIEGTKEGSKKREKIDEQYAQKRAEIEYTYAVAELKSQIDFAEQYIKVWGAAGNDVTENEKELSRLRMQLSDIETQHLIDNKAKEGKAWRERLEEVEKGLGNIRDLNANVTGFISDMLSAGIEKQKQQIDAQIEDIDRRKQAEIDAINASADTDEEKRRKTDAAEKKAAADKAQLERQQAQLEERRARFDKAANVARIGIETALAVVHQLSSGDPFTAVARAIAAGAVGAAQLAVAIATPIPKFKDGRDGGAATFAIVGDGGVPEVVASPDLSQAYVTPAKDTFTYLQKDWKVFPNMEAFKTKAALMAGAPALAGLPVMGNDNSDVVHALKSGFGSLREVVRNKQENHIYWKNGELMKATKRANDWTIYIQNNF